MFTTFHHFRNIIPPSIWKFSRIVPPLIPRVFGFSDAGRWALYGPPKGCAGRVCASSYMRPTAQPSAKGAQNAAQQYIRRLFWFGSSFSFCFMSVR